MFKHFVICWGILFPTIVFSYTEQDIQKLSISNQWLKLLHYRKAYLTNYKSEEDSAKFYFANDGKISPYNELVADIKELEGPQKKEINSSFQCLFPARYRFLKTSLKLQTNDIVCSLLSNWLKTIDGDSITLISANSYPQNPISTFGHTFLRINSGQKAESQILENSSKADLLDYSIGFAADSPPAITGLSYIFKGVFGGFNGQFNVVPYYLKTREYNNLESRDIWEYELSFTREETRFLLLHLWELGNSSSFDYYFFDENCSYQILTLLDVTRDGLNLASEFPFYTAPIETVKIIANKYHLVTKIKYRPSLYTKMKLAQLNLSDKNREELKLMLGDEKLILTSENPKVLEALIAYYSYLKQKGSNFFKKEDNQKYYAALKNRSHFDSLANNDNTFTMDKNSPHNSHDTSLINLSTGLIEKRLYNEFKFSGGYHDYMTNETGYPHFSKFDILSFKLRYSHRFHDLNGKLQIQEISPLEIISLIPYDKIDHSVSWSGGFKYYRSIENQNLGIVKIGGSVGMSFLVHEKTNSLIYSLLGPEITDGPFGRFKSNLNWQAGLITSIAENLKLNASYIFNYNISNNAHMIYQTPGFIASWNIVKNIDILLGTTFFYSSINSRSTNDYKLEFRKFF